MKTANWMFALVVAALVAAVGSLYFPESLKQLEEIDFFVWERDFLLHKLSEPPGLVSLLAAWMWQFFRWPVVGALCYVLPLVCAGLLAADIPHVMGRSGNAALGWWTPLWILLLTPWELETMLQGCSFFMLLWIGLHLRKVWSRGFFLIIISVVGFFMLAWPLLILLLVVLTLEHMARYRKYKVIFFTMAALAWAWAEVRLSSDLLEFIPFGRRYLYSPMNGVAWGWVMLLYIIGVQLMFVPGRGTTKKMRWLSWGIALLLVVLVLGGVIRRRDLRTDEHCLKLEHLADRRDWEGILKEISPEELHQNKVALVYALLAESERGTLCDNLLKYPISSSEDFLYRSITNRICCNFNRQFYENLGLYDEAFRQATQLVSTAPEGISFGSLRHQMRYAIMEGDVYLGRKYAAVLGRSDCHAAWVRNAHEAIRKMEHVKEIKPLMNQNFIGYYNLDAEMYFQHEYWPRNQKLLDYSLCSALLDRKMGHFMRLIKEQDTYYMPHKMPRIFKEAIVMTAHSQRHDLAEGFLCPPEMESAFIQFYDLYTHNPYSPQLRAYQDTYWFYYYVVGQDKRRNVQGAVLHQILHGS